MYTLVAVGPKGGPYHQDQGLEPCKSPEAHNWLLLRRSAINRTWMDRKVLGFMEFVTFSNNYAALIWSVLGDGHFLSNADSRNANVTPRHWQSGR